MIKTYVINLDQDTEKWKNIQKRFPWTLNRVSAIDGDHVERPFFTTRLIYGCLLSHRKVWKLIVESREPALILEDDCHPLDGFTTSFKNLILTLPKDFDVAILGYVSSDVNGDELINVIASPIIKRRPLRKVNEDWYVPGFFIGLHCYLVSPKGAKKLLSNPSIFHVDSVVCRNTNLTIYCPKETIASQGKKGFIGYNQYMTWEWIMVEPILGVGRYITIRNIHVIFCILLILFLMATSQNFFYQSIVIVIISTLAVNYLRKKYFQKKKDGHIAYSK